MYYLKMTLEGVLQSYGNGENVWRLRRDTQIAPTKDAVIGIIGCALGLQMEDTAYKALNDLTYLYIQTHPAMILDDYQVIRPKEPRKSFEDSYFWSPDGSHNKIQYTTVKEYLTNTSYTVYVGCEDKQSLRQIHRALRDPVWPYYLGRACCTPGRPIAEKEFILYYREELEGAICTCLS